MAVRFLFVLLAAMSSVAQKSTATRGAFSAHCFRGFAVGSTYAYDFVTDLFFEKSVQPTMRTHRRNVNVELAARLTPVSDVDDGSLIVKLQIENAHIVDVEGWAAYDADGDDAAVDPTAADAQLLEMLQKDFYYTQHCNMEITDVHYPDDEAKFALNLKQLLVNSFSHRLALDAAEGRSYTQNERDHLGTKRVTYEHLSVDEQRRRRSVGDGVAGDDERVLTVLSRHNAPRSVPMSIKGMAGSAEGAHNVDLDQHEHKETQFRDGVVLGLELQQQHEFPGKNTVDEMAADAAAAANRKYDAASDGHRAHTDTRNEPDARFAAASAGFQMRSGGVTRIKLRSQRARRIPDAEPMRVASFGAYAAVRHGDDAVRFVSRSPHEMHDDADVRSRLRSAGDDARLTIEDLALKTIDARYDVSRDWKKPHSRRRNSEGPYAWRQLLHRLSGPEHDATIQALRSLLFDNAEQTRKSSSSSSSISDDVRQHLFSLLGEVGDKDSCNALLDIATSAADNSRDRHAALFALGRVRVPPLDVVARIEAVVHDCDVHKSMLCTQLLLVFGSMASSLHHAKQPQEAHNIRELLFVLLDKSISRTDKVAATLYAIALNNTMAFVDAQDEALFRVTLGKYLNTPQGEGARTRLFDGEFLGERFGDSDVDDEQWWYWQRGHDVPIVNNGTLAKRSEAPPAPLNLASILGGKTGTSGWKKWYEGWSVSSRKNEYLPGGGIDQSGQNWGLPSDQPGEPQYGIDGLNKDGKARSKGFLEECKGTYRDGKSCASKAYDNYAPKNPDQGWQKKLGSGDFYAMIEAALQHRADGAKNKQEFFFKLDFFAGAQFSGSLMGKKVSILAAYARANVSITDERDKCSFFDVGLYYFYFGKTFFWGIGSNDCQYVDSTCKPWFPIDKSQMGYIQFAHEVFFEMTFQFALGPIPMVVFIQGVGGAGMYWSVDMIFAPALKDKFGNECGGIDDGGGSMLNGYCEPEAYISLAAELGIGIPVLAAGIGIKLELIRVSFPASAGLNFITQRPCFGLGVSIGALGGEIYLWARIGLCKGWIKICIKLQKTIYDWKGLAWEKPLLRKDCCKPCPGACNNAWCDYKAGKCVCNDNWGGKLCNMNCPLMCKDIETINPGVKCMINPDPNSHGELCECKEGYYGWNCLIPCPGIRASDPLPHQICSGHGICGDFGYQSSTGFGIDNDFDNTLVAACQCDQNYYGEMCDITCPADPETGRVCGGGGGVCVYDGQRAFCQCLKGYAGPNCKARCPLFRGSPCGYRGDCVWANGRATCHCQMGFSGEGCQFVDESGGGRALMFNAPDNYYLEVADWTRLRADSNQYTVGMWFKLTDMPASTTPATLMTWRWGRILLTGASTVKRAGGARLMFCDARAYNNDEGCIVSPMLVDAASPTWHFIYVTTSSFTLAHDKQLWHGFPAAGGACSVGQLQPSPYNNWCIADVSGHENVEFATVKGNLRFALNYTGLLDNLQIFNDRPTTAQVNDRVHHVQAPDDSALLFSALCDEGRGEFAYDERNMLAAQFQFPEGFDAVSKGPQYFWANPSGVALMTGALYSNMSDVMTIGNGSDATLRFRMRVGASKVNAAKLHFAWTVNDDQLCAINVQLLSAVDGDEMLSIVDDNGAMKRYNGQGNEIVTLTEQQLRKLGAIATFKFSTAEDSVSKLPCVVTIDEIFIEALAPVSEPMVELTGRPSAYAATTQHKPLKQPFTIEMWLIRPPLLHSTRGLLLALIDAAANGSLAAIDGPFLLYETGFPLLGMQYRYQGQSNKVLAGGHDQPFKYTVPTGEWVHFAVTVSPAANSKCLHTFYVNGEVGDVSGVGSRDGSGETLLYPGPMSNVMQGDKPNYCAAAAALEGWGDSRYELRVGARFLGAINDIVIWPSALSQLELRRNMHRIRSMAELAPALHAYDFSGAQPAVAGGEPVVFPDRAGGNAQLTMRDGAHLGLIVALDHEWTFCPGISYQEPESVCGSEPSHSHGRCFKSRAVRDRDTTNNGADDDQDTREKGYQCECTGGYRAGLGGACSVECPGGYANPCNGRGRCIGAVAPIEAWEGADGSVNTSYVSADDPNMADQRQSEEVSCVCDEGYVGEACEFECPGWSEPWNRPQRICSGYGHCNVTAGVATCTCFDSSQRYGASCEFAYGSKPDQVVSECGPCDGSNEQCRDTYCSCIDGYFRVFGQCRPYSAEFAVEDNTTATIAASMTVLALCLICVAAASIVYFLKLRK